MDLKPLGLSLVIIVFFAILETSAQNFYPLRYGKRDNNQASTEGRYLRGGPKYDRRADISSNNDLFYASRYGKRSYNSTPQAEVPAEFGTIERNGRYGRSPESDTSGRTSGFYFGSRFGKRSEERRQAKTAAQEYPGNEIRSEQSKTEADKSDYIVCRYTGLRRLYRCLPEGYETDVSSQDQVL